MNTLVKLMLEKFDISQMSFTVVPVGSTVLTSKTLTGAKFCIINGRHRYLAVKEIERRGLMKKL